MSASFCAPMFTCTLTPSAPFRSAFSTVFTSTFEFGSGLQTVLPERCRISPMSLP